MRVMSKSINILLVLLISSWSLEGHPTDFLEDEDSDGFDVSNEENELEARRGEALEKLQQVLGIRGHAEKTIRRKVPPQFMMELYNNVADPSGVTRGRNPYNAKVVRSFIERDTSMSRFYFFNITGLEVNESVLEAELHLYRRRTPLKAMHPSTLASPYYLIRVYQVLDERSLDVPDLHRLLNVRYVGAHASGWQIFNVKQAVLAWLSGEPNLGLLVTASTLFEDQVTVEFSRRNEYHHSKQPILVLFDDDGKEHRAGKKTVPRYYTYGNDIESELLDEKIDLKKEYDAEKQQRGQPEEARWEANNKSEFYQRQKRRESKILLDDEATENDEDPGSPRRRRELQQGPTTSSDIYEAAERLSENRRREKRSHATSQQNTTECARHELYVDFKEIGLSSSIIAPLGYSAFHCKGVCESPLSQDHQPTNHATIQGIVHKMGLVKGVERPCCVPTKLLGTTILFYDDNENVVLKVHQDMIADRCGCR